MRRMLSNKNVVDVVNNAIEQGEIEVGGGLPEIESGDAGKALVVNEQEDGVEWGEVGAPDNVLVLPDEAPAAQKLVGINTSNEQNALGIGDGLEINNNIISVPAEIVKIDCQTKTLANQANSLSISDELAEKLQAITTLVLLTNLAAGNTTSRKMNGMLFAHYGSTASTVLNNITLGGETNYDTFKSNGAYYDYIKRSALRINGSAGGYYLTVEASNGVGIITQVYNQFSSEMVSFTLDTLSGTKTMPDVLKQNSQNKVWSHLLLNNGSEYVRLFINYISTSNPYHLVATGEDDTYKYTLSWYGTADGTHTAGEYTITQTAK